MIRQENIKCPTLTPVYIYTLQVPTNLKTRGETQQEKKLVHFFCSGTIEREDTSFIYKKNSEMESKALAIFCILLATAATLAVATLEQDENDCADQMANMAECIPYVSGSAKKPTPTCCADAEKVRSAKPKCLCVLIIESTDTSMGLPINTTLALQMPTACKSDAKVSDCPSKHIPYSSVYSTV